MITLIQHLAVFLQDMLLKAEESVEQNFRIGFYVEKSGYMVPLCSWDLVKQSKVFLRSYRDHREKFSITCVRRPACVVRCIRDQRMISISDFEKELNGFLHDDQGHYLKSLVAFPIIGDIPGFFNQEDEQSIRTYMEQFATRLDLEAAVDIRLAPRQKTADEPNPRGTGDGQEQGEKGS